MDVDCRLQYTIFCTIFIQNILFPYSYRKIHESLDSLQNSCYKFNLITILSEINCEIYNIKVLLSNQNIDLKYKNLRIRIFYEIAFFSGKKQLFGRPASRFIKQADMFLAIKCNFTN